MKNLTRKNYVGKLAAVIMLITVMAAGCKKSNDEPQPIPPPVPLTTSYTLKAKDVIGVSGAVTIAESSSGSSESIVTISLSGASGVIHPAHIHTNSAVETGGIAYPLNDVDASGKSVTTLAVPYNTLINFDGYINVHLDVNTLGTIIAQGDIGGNALTGINHIYILVQDSTSGVSGNAKFEKRKNGNTLVTVSLTSGAALPPGLYPAHINLGSITTVGIPVIKKTLNPVDGISRLGVTNIRNLDDGTAITYDNWMVYDGFMSIHDAADVNNIISKCNIGSN